MSATESPSASRGDGASSPSSPGTGTRQLPADFSLLPLKAGDHIWRSLPGGNTQHALFVGQFIAASTEDLSSAEAAAVPPSAGEGASPVPHSVITLLPVPSRNGVVAVERVSLDDFVQRNWSDDGIQPPADDASSESTGGNREKGCAASSTSVRLYTRRPRSRREAVLRALALVGRIVEASALKAFPQVLPWWAIFDEKETFQPGLCSTRAFAKPYRQVAREKDSPVQLSLLSAILAGGAVVRQGRVVLRGARLVKALRLSRAATTGWANLGGFVGQAIASSILDDGDTSTAAATAAGGWAGGIAGTGLAAAAASTMGVEVLGAGSLTGGLVLCSAAGAAGAVAGASLAYAAKKVLEPAAPGVDRTAEYYDCPLRLIGGADDVFDLYGAALEFPPEDSNDEPGSATSAQEDGMTPRVAVAGWYAARARPEDLQKLASP